MELLINCAAILILTLPGSFETATTGTPRQSKEPVWLEVSGEIEHPVKLSARDIAGLPHVTVKTKEHSGEEATFEGVALIQILNIAGMELGEGLRGKALSTYLVVKASDNYQVIFTPPELDPAFTDRVVLLADKKNGSPLPPSEGPLRIVVPDEKRQARWVRNVISISVRHAH